MNKPADLIAPESFEVRFTADEFMRLLFSDVFEDARLELIEGELVHMAPPSGGHASKQAAVIGALWPVARAEGLHLVGEVAIRVSDASVLVCDAALLRRLPEDRSAVDPLDVLLVVEVAETTTHRDLVHKPGAYAAAGIPTYWAIEGGQASSTCSRRRSTIVTWITRSWRPAHRCRCPEPLRPS